MPSRNGVRGKALKQGPQRNPAEVADLLAAHTQVLLDVCDGEDERRAILARGGWEERPAMSGLIAHLEKERTVLDAIREVRPPFSPDGVVKDFAELLKSYGVAKVSGDHYAGEWPRERFKVHGIMYEPSKEPKSGLYRALLPAVNSSRVELLDHPRLRAQFLALERRVSRSGNDSIDHPPGGHDDLANAAAGALTRALEQRAPIRWWLGAIEYKPGAPSVWRGAPRRTAPERPEAA